MSIDLPGRPRWCVTDADADRVFLCIREPSMVLVARLPDLGAVTHWKLPAGGAHGLDIDHASGRLYAACDEGALVEIDSSSGEVANVWPIAGPPDVTFFNPATGLVHVAIGEPGLSNPSIRAPATTTRTLTGVGRAYDGDRSAGPALRDFTRTWRPAGAVGHLMAADPKLSHRRTSMKWITREHVKVDRVACPWLIRKFVDKDAEFVFVARRPGDDGGEAPRRHPLRRQGRRAWPSRQGMLVRGDPQEIQADRRSGADAARARSSTAPTPTTRSTINPRGRASKRSPKDSGISASRTTTRRTPPNGSSTTRFMPTAGKW